MLAMLSEVTDRRELKKPSCFPGASSEVVRARWLDLLALSEATRRVTCQQIEPGFYAVVVPRSGRQARKQAALEVDLRAAIRQVPTMSRGVRLTLDRLPEYELKLEGDFRQWMGPSGNDVASGLIGARAFVDLAYLEAALLKCLSNRDVDMEFNSPLTFFRRGLLVDYANVLEAVTAMVFEGRSLADTASQLAHGVLGRLELYASYFLKPSGLYKDCRWQIEGERFILGIERVSLAFQYWELRGDDLRRRQVFATWCRRIEDLLREMIPLEGRQFPKSFAA